MRGSRVRAMAGAVAGLMLLLVGATGAARADILASYSASASIDVTVDPSFEGLVSIDRFVYPDSFEDYDGAADAFGDADGDVDDFGNSFVSADAEGMATLPPPDSYATSGGFSVVSYYLENQTSNTLEFDLKLTIGWSLLAEVTGSAGGLDGEAFASAVLSASVGDDTVVDESYEALVRGTGKDERGTTRTLVIPVILGAGESLFVGLYVQAYGSAMQAVPEPSSLALAAIGAAGLVACGWRRRRA